MSERREERELDPSIIIGCANLLDQIDKKILVALRDGRTLIGVLRSVDQFANLFLQDAVERIHVGKKYGDIPRGVFLVRGDNVVLIGEIDAVREQRAQLTRVTVEEILAAQREETDEKLRKEALRNQAFKQRGLIFQIDSITMEES